jgi:hypothetical protein
MANIPFLYSKFKITAEIGGTKFDDVVAISATFGLNSIPTATLTVAVGFDAKSGGSKKATIHTARPQLKPRDKAKVTLTIEAKGLGGTVAGAKEAGTFTIFEGFLAGIGYQRSHNSANYVLQLVHWLDDLNNSSALNGDWHPNAPFLMASNAAWDALSGEGGGTFSSVPIIDSNESIITKGNIEGDLWESVIKEIFKKIANFDVPDGIRKNDAALKALDKMKSGTPLRLKVSDLNGYNIEQSVRTELTKDALESFAYTTFWDKLTGELGPSFFFAIAPAIEEAYVVPFFGGLKHDGKPEFTIKGDEYSYANFNATMTQLLECVMVFWPSQMDPMLGTGGQFRTTDRYAYPSGVYPPNPTNADKPGKKLYKDLPGWLTNMSPWPIMTGPTTGIKGKRPGDCLAPQTGESNPPPEWLLPPDIADAMAQGGENSVCGRFAHHWYKTEFLSQRYGELSGKLRFDIAPGSIVKIETPEMDVKQGLIKDKAMIGAVTSVSYVINAERALAGTSFTLAYIRTEEEDKDKDITNEHAPLYVEGTKWPGDKLKKG